MTHIESNNRMVQNLFQDQLDLIENGERPSRFKSEFADFDAAKFLLRLGFFGA